MSAGELGTLAQQGLKGNVTPENAGEQSISGRSKEDGTAGYPASGMLRPTWELTFKKDAFEQNSIEDQAARNRRGMMSPY